MVGSLIMSQNNALGGIVIAESQWSITLEWFIITHQSNAAVISDNWRNMKRTSLPSNVRQQQTENLGMNEGSHFKDSTPTRCVGFSNLAITWISPVFFKWFPNFFLPSVIIVYGSLSYLLRLLLLVNVVDSIVERGLSCRRIQTMDTWESSKVY